MNVDQTYDRLYRVRHSAAHVLATAMLDLFPDAQMGIGPPTDDGFYYDFELPRALTPDDLKSLQKLMLKHKKANYPFDTPSTIGTRPWRTSGTPTSPSRSS